MRAISGCIKALPLPVKSIVVTSISQLKALASSGILDGLVGDDNLLRLTLPTESKIIVATTSELVVASSTDLVTTNDQDTLVGIDKEESYFPNALNFIVIGCMIILLAFGCGIICSGTAILCLSIFQAVILEYNYQMISSLVAVIMKCLSMIFSPSSSNVDLNDADKVAKVEELAVSTLRSSSLCLDMSSSVASNELDVPIDDLSDVTTTAIVSRSDSSDASTYLPHKRCIIAFLLLIFTSLNGIVDTLSVVDFIDWLILLTLVGSMMLFSTANSKQRMGSDVEKTINTSMSSASSGDIDTNRPASRSADDTQSQSKSTLTLSNWKQEVPQLPSATPFSLMGTLQACLSSGFQHVQHERHNLLIAFLLMACTPIPVMVAVLIVLLDFWTVLQALFVATCLVYITTYITKALHSIPTYLRGLTTALVIRVYQFNPINTICNINSDESCLITLLLMVIIPLMSIVVVMMMLFLASFNWSLVVQVLAECTIMSCLPAIRQACGVVTLMMCLKSITYYLLRLWQYQLSITCTFLDVIGASGPLVNRMSWLFAVISFALTYYDDGGGVHTRRGMLYSDTIRTVTPPTGYYSILYSAITRTLSSIWTIFLLVTTTVVKKLVYLIAYMSILLVHVIIMLVQSIDYKAVMYTSAAYLFRLPITIILRSLGRLLAPFNQVEQKELPPPPVSVEISDDEDSDDDDSTIDFGAADPIDDFDCVMPPPPSRPKRRTRRRKEYPPAVWHRGRGGRGGRLRPTT